MTTRTKLRPRRLGLLSKLEVQNHKFFLRTNFDPAGAIKEIFLDQDQGRSGSNIETFLDDAAVLVSLCLQFGMSLEQIADKLSRDSDPDTLAASKTPLSMVGTLVRRAIEIEAEHGQEIATAYRKAEEDGRAPAA